MLCLTGQYVKANKIIFDKLGALKFINKSRTIIRSWLTIQGNTAVRHAGFLTRNVPHWLESWRGFTEIHLAAYRSVNIFTEYVIKYRYGYVRIINIYVIYNVIICILYYKYIFIKNIHYVIYNIQIYQVWIIQ